MTAVPSKGKAVAMMMMTLDGIFEELVPGAISDALEHTKFFARLQGRSPV
jgi:hypothetical protein